MYKKTVRDIELAGKKVLVRVDYNVPLNEDGSIANNYRVKQSLPTLNYLLEQGCSVIICSHLGRPTSKKDLGCSLRPIASELTKLLEREVRFVPDCVGDQVRSVADKLKAGQVLLLENLRFYPEEEQNDDNFAAQLAQLADIYVQDGFGVVHRPHSSTEAITRHIPSVAGLLLEREVDTICGVMDNPDRPLMAIIGGAKIADKIDVLNRFIDIADVVAVGGAMANTFLQAQGIPIGKSLSQESDVPLAKDILERAAAKTNNQKFTFIVPVDGVVAKCIDSAAQTRIVGWNSSLIAAIEHYPKKAPASTARVGDNEKILDIGPVSAALISGCLQLVQTVVWNGAMGVTETPALQGSVGPFARGTEAVIDAILHSSAPRPFSLVGGGDTVGYIEQKDLSEVFSHISTGGGASLELMSGKTLPGVEALLDK